MGTVDMSLQNVGVNITCIPTGVAENSFDTYFGSLDVGEDLATASIEIKTTTIGGLDFDCAAVQILDLQKRFSPTDNRLGQLTMAGRRNFATGVPSALFAVNTVTA
jgi:hypothetical protein